MRDFTYAPSETALDYLHVDENFLIVNKPAGLLSVPGKTEPDCLEARIQSDYPEALTIHRLDMATSGVMVFARNKDAQRHIGLQFEKRYIEKSYIADVWGHVKEEAGMVDLPLRCDWPNRPKQIVCHEHGKPSQTSWQRLKQYDRHCRVRLLPKTGRSHQLRVHMLSLGHPILGDRLYAHDVAFLAASRLHLHAESLKLRRPIGGEWCKFSAPAPF